MSPGYKISKAGLSTRLDFFFDGSTKAVHSCCAYFRSGGASSSCASFTLALTYVLLLLVKDCYWRMPKRLPRPSEEKRYRTP